LNSKKKGEKIKDFQNVDSNDSLFRRGHLPDHINEFGFVNDGYNYSQHLKDFDDGGLVFGNELTELILKAKQLNLPEEVFPAGDINLDELNVITISDSCMDADLRAALFDELDENGLPFEELDDDFIQQAMAEPEIPDFDFESHVRKLIALSESSLGLNSKANLNSLLDDASYVPNEEDLDNSEIIEDDDFNEELNEVLKDYEDEESAKEDDDDGIIDIFALNQDNLEEKDSSSSAGFCQAAFNEALDEFIEENTKEEVRKVSASKFHGFQLEEIDEDNDNFNFSAAYKDQLLLQQQCEEELVYLNAESKLAAEVAAKEQSKLDSNQDVWDCESIVSTYSTTQNIPTTLGDRRAMKLKYNLKKFPIRNPTSVSAPISNQIMLIGRQAAPLCFPFENQKPKSAVQVLGTNEAFLDNKSNFRSRKVDESTEEHRVRKQSIKAERKVNRLLKKELKKSFQKVITVQHSQQNSDVSVFHYS
jgi:protein LTV1